MAASAHFEEIGYQADWPSNMSFHAQVEVSGPGLSGLRATDLKVCGVGGMSMDLGIGESGAKGKPAQLELSERRR